MNGAPAQSFRVHNPNLNKIGRAGSSVSVEFLPFFRFCKKMALSARKTLFLEGYIKSFM